MTTQALTILDQYRLQQAVVEQRAPESPDWLREARRQALERFLGLGFPTATRGNERWKYTNVTPIARAEFTYPEVPHSMPEETLRSAAFWATDWDTLVFVDGHHAPALSTPFANHALRPLYVGSLAEALVQQPQMVQAHLTRYAGFADEAFTALNTAFLHDGALVYLPVGTELERPLHILHVTAAPQAAVLHPRVLIVLERGSRATVMESYLSVGAAAGFTNPVAEFALESGAYLDHYRLLMEHPEGFHVGNTRVLQDRDSEFRSTSFARGMALARNDVEVTLDAPGASCTVNGLYLTYGSQHIDNHIEVDHAKPHTTSAQCFKGILAGASHAIFSGRVLVRQDAQKAAARQSDRNLLLSSKAEADSKPSMEIYADDVQCTHGATVGSVADEALFYMQARGLDRDTATRLLIQGFAQEVLESVAPDQLRAYLDDLASDVLPHFYAEETA